METKDFTKYSKELQSQVARFKHGLALELLDKLTQEQKDLFCKLYPKGLGDAKTIDRAIDVISRTLVKNEAGR